MAYGLHWEWRGFGGVNSKFAKRFSKLNTVIDEHAVDDFYICTPGLETNIKVRKGVENGLKFKRPGKLKGRFEQWNEQENEVFGFPISQKGRAMLLESLKSTRLNCTGSIPSGLDSADDYITWLEEIGCRVVEVRKERETKEWSQSNGSVMIEWACLYKPQSIISISLESDPFEPSDSQKESEALNLLKSTYNNFDLHNMPLCTKNYLEAVTIWANSNKI